MKKALIAIVLVSLLLLLTGCNETEEDPNPPIVYKVNPNASTSGQSSGAQFIECLKNNNIKVYTTSWCKPCHDTTEDLFNSLALQRKFSSDKDFTDSFNDFMENVYVNCSRKCEERHNKIYILQGDIYKLEFLETTFDPKNCVECPVGQYPSWFKGDKYLPSGYDSLSDLSRRTGCRIQ